MKTTSTSISLRLAAVAICFSVAGCVTKTPVEREASARPRIEQKALMAAMEDAFQSVSFAELKGKKVFLFTQSLTQIDKGFIDSFVSERLLFAGAIPVGVEKDADYKVINIVEVSGTDDIKKFIVRNSVKGEYRSTITIIDLKSESVVKRFELNSTSELSR